MDTKGDNLMEWRFFAPWSSWYIMLAAILVMWLAFGGELSALLAAAGIGFGGWILFQILANNIAKGAAAAETEKSKDWHRSIQMVHKINPNLECVKEQECRSGTTKNTRTKDQIEIAF